MPSTFGSFVVRHDEAGYRILHAVPKQLEASEVQRFQYAGPRVIMPETVPDLNEWLPDRKKEGFT